MTVQEGALLCERYRLQHLVGRGGMADVYLAFDNVRQAQVAVKVLREDLAEDPDFVRRFRREAEALAHLEHPNIVRFYAFEKEGPVAFIVMDYIEGATLRRQLHDQGKPLDVKEITSILHDLCSALHYAHRNGFVHRDLKPGNVMLKRDGKALLTDFGIARAIEGVTMTAAVMGTPAYMSPEQVEGKEVDAASDIYSLGVLLFEMATGRRPFTGDEPGLAQTSTTTRVQEAHVRLPPPEPRSLNPRLPAAASAVILRALAKRPADRWPDVVSLRRAWEDAVGVTFATASGRAVPREEPRPPAQPVSMPVRRSFPRWALAVLAAGLLIAIVAWALVSRTPRAEVARQDAAPATVSDNPVAVPPTVKPAPQGGGVQVATRGASAAASPAPVRATATVADRATAASRATLVPTRTVAPTRTPIPPTVRPTAGRATATIPPSTGGVDLVSPYENERIIGSAEFVWRNQSNFSLKPGENYELIVWGVGEDPMQNGRSPVGRGAQTRAQANLTGVETVLRLSPGKTYYWGVRLMLSDATPVRMLSAGRKFIYERLEQQQPTADPGCTGPLCP